MKTALITLRREISRRIAGYYGYDLDLKFNSSDANPIPVFHYSIDYNKAKLVKKICFNNRNYALLFVNDESVIKHIAMLKIIIDKIRFELVEKQFNVWEITEKGVKNVIR